MLSRAENSSLSRVPAHKLFIYIYLMCGGVSHLPEANVSNQPYTVMFHASLVQCVRTCDDGSNVLFTE